MATGNFKNRLLLSVTGEKEKDWQKKLADLTKLKESKAALFLTRFDETQRKKIYRALLDSSLREIPLCHIKNDMEVEELVFLESKFNTKYFTFHEKGFAFLGKWPGFEKKIYLEMNVDDYISPKVEVEKIGGFCVDLSHFKAALADWDKDFEYVYERKGKVDFGCNHLNGYDEKNNTDMHTVKSLKDFDYLKTLPEFLFGKAIAIEVDNEIEEQVKFKKYLVEFLNNLFLE